MGLIASAIVAHNASAIATYLRHGVPHANLCATLTAVAIPPTPGAWLSTRLNNEQFEGLLAFVMVAVLLLKRKPPRQKECISRRSAQEPCSGSCANGDGGFGRLQIAGFVVLPTASCLGP